MDQFKQNKKKITVEVPAMLSGQILEYQVLSRIGH